MANLNLKQIKFIESYLVNLHAQKAAIDAGYSVRSASTIGCLLLKKPNVQAEIERRRSISAEKSQITVDRVLAEYARVGFANMGDFMKWDEETGTSLIPSKKLSEAQRAAVAKVKVTRRRNYDRGQLMDETFETELRLHDKIKALDSIAKHLGMFESEEDVEKGRAKLKEFVMNYARGPRVVAG